MIAKLNGTVPKGTNLEETVDDLVWNDEFEVRPGAEKPPAGAVERAPSNAPSRAPLRAPLRALASPLNVSFSPCPGLLPLPSLG